jgi:hypothetical protein
MDRPNYQLQILAELRAVRAEQEEQREALDDLARRLLTSDDRRIGMPLIRILANLFGHERFAAVDIAAKALHRQDTAGQALCELIGDRLGKKGGVLALGWLLARLEGVRFKGYRLVAAGENHGIRLWRVSPPSKPAASDTPREGD